MSDKPKQIQEDQQQQSQKKEKKQPEADQQKGKEAQTQKKGEPWKPKEKFDKKGNKEKKKLEEEAKQQQTGDKKEEVSATVQQVEKTTEGTPIKNPQQAEKHVQQKPLEINIKEKPNQVAKPTQQKDVVPDQIKKHFLSHLKVYHQHSTNSIRQLGIINSQLLHPALIQVGISYQNGSCMGSTYRCVEFLRALKQYIQDFKTPQGTLTFEKSLDGQLEGIQTLISEFRSVNEGMKTSQKFIRYLMSILFRGRYEEQLQKDWLCEQIDWFVESKILKASDLIIQNASVLVRNDIQVLVYARSYLVENFLIQQHRQGKKIHVIVVDNPPFHEGKKLLKSLEKEGLSCSYILLSHISYIIQKVDKIFVGAHSMLSNGALISRVGTALLACLAYVYRITFHVFCETYKFSEFCQIDSLSWNELSVRKLQTDSQKHQEISLMYDLTPSEQINMIVTEIGLIPPTSIKAILREFKKQNYVDKVEAPKQYQD